MIIRVIRWGDQRQIRMFRGHRPTFQHQIELGVDEPMTLRIVGTINELAMVI
ncbi:MAG: hypothetical protein M3332_14700 [Actinomycetota bacterium]|jgi:hypothetical protein|nr:hypothetical protein [Actinomycetota bacterium]